MSEYPVPRGTKGWPAELDMLEAEQSGDAAWIVAPATAELRRREIAAGYAHIARLAVDGGPITETRHRKRSATMKMLDGLICALGVALITGVLVLGMYEVLR